MSRIVATRETPTTRCRWSPKKTPNFVALYAFEQRGNGTPSGFDKRDRYGRGQEKHLAAQARRGVPLSGGAAAPATGRRQRDHEFPHQIRRQVRHVRGGRLRGLRALLF